MACALTVALSSTAGTTRAADTTAVAPPLGITDRDLRFDFASLDEGSLVLLNGGILLNHRDWRRDFAGQVQGFPIRSKPRKLSAADVIRLRDALLDRANWSSVHYLCSFSPDAALLMSGPRGSVSAVFDLSCHSVRIRDEGIECASAGGNAGKVGPLFTEIVRAYFPPDSIDAHTSGPSR